MLTSSLCNDSEWFEHASIVHHPTLISFTVIPIGSFPSFLGVSGNTAVIAETISFDIMFLNSELWKSEKSFLIIKCLRSP